MTNGYPYHVYECIRKDGVRLRVKAGSEQLARVWAGCEWRVEPSTVIARYRYTVLGPKAQPAREAAR